MPTRARRIRLLLREALSSARDLATVVETADRILRPAIGATGGAWSTVDPATMLGTSCRVLVDLGGGPVELPHDPDRELLTFAVEWDDVEPNTFLALRREGRSAGILFHDVGDLGVVGRVERLLRPLGASDEARMLLTDGAAVWGTAVLYRMDGGTFGVADADVLTAAASVVGAAVRRSLLVGALDWPTLPSPPGSLVLTPDGSITLTSPAAEQLLEVLGEHHARTALASLAAAWRRHGPTSTRVVAERGVVVLHADAVKGVPDSVSVVVESPRPIELVPLVVEAWGLTPRQRQVTEALLAGLGRSAVAQRLAMSEHTVAETASAIFRKAGVASRSELCACLFADFFAEPFHEGVAPSPTGYFLPPVHATSEPPG